MENVNGIPRDDRYEEGDRCSDSEMVCDECRNSFPFRFWFRAGQNEPYNGYSTDTTCPECGAHEGFQSPALQF